MLTRRSWTVWTACACLGAGVALTGCGIPDPDSDGDHFPLSQDCNDTDALVHPGAEDICYDGIDQDCNAGDLLDCDHDGARPVAFGGDDCDDSDPTIYDGAEEIPYDGLDQDCQGGDLVDQDRDGIFGSQAGGADCNDTNASIYPGALEVPYDQIDQDCSGADLDDVDGDGAAASVTGGPDCDDFDDATYPGAVEVPYDGRDQDCDGADTVDVDGDGFAGGAEGDDCDDDNSSAYPQAEEIPYNELDEDCDGADLADVDEDGALPDFLGGSDCDDNNSLTYGGADEVLCNAIDEDCDGLFADLDCDGHLLRDLGGDDCDDDDAQRFPGNLELLCNARDEDCDGLNADEDCDGANVPPLGGDDCDDTNANRHSGALEFVNTLDDNCDGSVDEAQEIADASARLKGQAGDNAGIVSAIGDLDDDGIADLAVGAPGNDGSTGIVYIYPGGAGFTDGDLKSAPYIVYGWEEGDLFGSALAMGDVTGDGVADLLVGAPGATDADDGAASSAGGAGRAYVFSGGSGGTLPWGPKARADAALWTFTGAAGGDRFGAAVAIVGNVAGDAIGDLVIGAPGASKNGAEGAGAAFLYLGASSAEQFRTTHDASAAVSGNSANQYVGGVVAGVGDLNGDGLRDVAISAPGTNGGSGRIGLFFGTFDPSGWVMSQPSVLLTAESGCGLGPVTGGLDLNGDGIDDLLAGAPEAGSNAQGKVYLLFGRGDWEQGAIDLSINNDGRFFGESDGDLFGSHLAAGSVDPDGQSDVLIGSAMHADGSGKVYLFRGASWGVREASTADAVWTGTEPGQLTGASLVLGDLDDDGRADLAVGAPGDAAGGAMAGTTFLYFWN